MRESLVLFPDNRPLHLLKLNSVICLAIRLAVHIVMVLSEDVLTQSLTQLVACAMHRHLLSGDERG